ncbi:MAG: hypothetical protein ACOYNC_12265 [Bacteroidales bacterium]
MTVHDTIPGLPLCSGLSELHFKVKSGSDTLTYTVVLHAGQALHAGNQVMPEELIYPNPATDFIHFLKFENEPFITVTVTGMTGTSFITRTMDIRQTPFLYIGDLARGILNRMLPCF